MKKTTLTEKKAEETPTGGVLVGKRKGQTIIHDKGTMSGYLVGKTHAEGGIKAVNKATGQPLEMQGGEVVITAPAVSDQTKNEFNGKMMTNREILSQINVNGGGVAFAKDGMEIPKKLKHTGATYSYGGKTMTDHEIYKHITGGHLAKGKTLSQIAKMHNVTLKQLQSQVNMGMKAESEHTSSKREQMKIVKDHLVENPKYYTLLKKAGLKKGGSLVKDAKSGNTPARDLNNYNDVVDVQSDGKVGGYSGIDMDGTGGADASAGVGAFDEGGVVNSVISKWEEVPDEFKKIQNIKKVDWIARPDNDGLYSIIKNFVGQDELRPALTYVEFGEYGVTATNAHILINLPVMLSKELEGIYSIKGKYNKVTSHKLITDSSYPDWKNIIKPSEEAESTYSFSVLTLLKYLKVAKRYVNYTQEVVLQIGDYNIPFNAEYFIDALEAINKLGYESYTLYFFKYNQGMVLAPNKYGYKLGEDDLILIMPILRDTIVLGVTNIDDNNVFYPYFSFNDSYIHDKGGEIVFDTKELKSKTTSTRKPRAKKEVQESKAKTLTKEELADSKIWIGDDIKLRDKVQQKLTELGFPRDDAFPRDKDRNIYIVTYSRDFVSWDGLEDFNSETKKEIFLSDLGITDSVADAKKEEKIQVFKLTGLVREGEQVFYSDYSKYGATELLKDLKDKYIILPDDNVFEYAIKNPNNAIKGFISFNRNINTYDELVEAIKFKESYDQYDWDIFFEYDRDTTPILEEQSSKTDEPLYDFSLERKYLTSRISDLSRELDLKKPILSNEEVAFYQREINNFIYKLRKLNDKERNAIPVLDRINGIYKIKFGDFNAEPIQTELTSINGVRSELTEQEYLNVRTPEFKSFFGDWESAYLNDSYAGVSKVINPKTKEPQMVFHGTNVLFVDWKTYDTNNAHYFAVKKEMSEFFASTWEERTDKAGVDSQILKNLNPNKGKFLYRCFIDVKNPIDFSRYGVDKYPINEYLTFLRVNYNIGDFDFWTNLTTFSGVTQDTEVYAWQIIRLWQNFTKYVKVFTTYDGYIFYEYIPEKTYGGLENASLSYCAFDSNQIKFTDAYEFNALSNDSRFDFGGVL